LAKISKIPKLGKGQVILFTNGEVGITVVSASGKVTVCLETGRQIEIDEHDENDAARIDIILKGTMTDIIANKKIRRLEFLYEKPRVISRKAAEKRLGLTIEG